MSVRALLDSPIPHVAYLARKLFAGDDDPAARKAMLEGDLVRSLVSAVEAWPGEPLASHKSASQAFHALSILADLDARRSDPGMERIGKRVLASFDPDGVPTLPMRISEAYGGTGSEIAGWALCDAPVTLAALARMGWVEEAGRGVERLAALRRENGWPCAVSGALGKWRGPGKKDDPCPYATLAMIKAVGCRRDGFGIERESGYECLLGLWRDSRERHPYMFYAGNDFRKLKFPFVWYDVLHVAWVLADASFDPARPRVPDLVLRDPRFLEMVDVIEAKTAGWTRFVPEAVYRRFEGFDFGQKKADSPTLELFARAVARAAGREVAER